MSWNNLCHAILVGILSKIIIIVLILNDTLGIHIIYLLHVSYLV